MELPAEITDILQSVNANANANANASMPPIEQVYILSCIYIGENVSHFIHLFKIV
jgi:hypothetical protein